MRQYNFDELPPTLNRLIGSRWLSHNSKKRWMVLLYEQMGCDQLPDPCHVKITWRVMHSQDRDNQVARFKVIGDALKRAGYIVDDSPAHLTLETDEVIVHHLREQGFTMDVDAGLD